MNQVVQGEIYWYDFGPAVGSAPADRRPCVVMQSDEFNESRIATTVVCAITSNLMRADAPGNIPLRLGEGGLPKSSVVNVSQIFTIDKAELDEFIGRLSRARVREVRQGLALLFGESL